MKLDTRGTAVEIYGAETEEQTFQIATSAIAFQTLSSKLYSDTIRAIIRELACNAWDAHVEVGLKTKPFELTLPTVMQPEFIIRDFGPGMADEKIMELYCTYFSSSKQRNNSQIGGFGIGSKSPFSYTEGFTVISRQYGLKRTYSAYVNENKIPAVVRLSTEETEDEDGLEVRFPVKASDVYEFESKAKTVLEFFDPLPVINRPNFKADKQEYLLEEKRWKVRKESSIDGVRIIMGLVQYKVQGFEGMGLDAHEKAVLSMPIDIFVPVGTVSPAATRESLTNDKVTVERTRKLLRDTYSEISQHFNLQMSAFKTGFECLVYLNDFSSTDGFGDIVRAIRGDLYKDTDLFASDVIKQVDYPKLKLVSYYREFEKISTDEIWSEGGSSTISFAGWNPFGAGLKSIIVADRATGGYEKVRKYVREHTPNTYQHSPEFIAILPIGGAKEGFDLQTFLDEADKFLKAVGQPPSAKLSALKVEDDPPAKVYQKKKVKSVVFVGNGQNGHQDNWNRTEDPLPTSGTQFYVITTFGKPIELDEFGRKGRDFSHMVDKMRNLEFLDFGRSKLYSFTQEANVPKNGATWVNLFKHFEERLVAYCNDPANTVTEYEGLHNLRQSCGIDSVKDKPELMAMLGSDSLYRKACDMARNLKKEQAPELGWVGKLKNAAHLKAHILKLTKTDNKTALKMRDQVKERYPLISEGYWGSTVGKLNVFYVNAVDAGQDWLANSSTLTEGECK